MTQDSPGVVKKDRDWFALYTRPRFEKKVNRELCDLDIQTFLPMRTVTKYWSDRKKRIDEPVFPSYVFIHANPKERYLAFQPQGVVRIVGFNGEPARIPPDQIDAVRRIMESGYYPEVHHQFSKGDPVEVMAGPLSGLSGFVADYRGANRFTIYIDGIRQALSVHIDGRYLKPIAKS